MSDLHPHHVGRGAGVGPEGEGRVEMNRFLLVVRP